MNTESSELQPEPSSSGSKLPAEHQPASKREAAHDQHLDTSHLKKDLGRRALSGGFLTAAAQGVRFLLNIASAVLLARLLSPQDFGLVAMTGALMSVLRTIREGGFSTATIQKQGITQAQISNLFWVNCVLGLAITSIGAVASPVVAWFFHDERLVPITVCLSVAFTLNGISAQHLALLNRQMNFRATAIIDIASATFGLLTGLAMAAAGAGYWSLVGMQLATALTETVSTWTASGWRPSLPSRNVGTKSLLRFGASMIFFVLLRRLSQGADVILLGRFYGAGMVGLYSRGLVLLTRPLDQFINPFDAVFLPVLSRLQDEPVKYRSVFLQAYGVIGILSFPLAGILLGLSAPIVLTLLGAKWVEVIPIFSWTTLSAFYIPLSYAGMWLLTTQGRGKDLVITGVVFPAITIGSVLVGLPFGAVGVAISMAVVGLTVRLPVQFYIVGRSGPVSTGDLWKAFSYHLPLGIVVAAAAAGARHLLAEQAPLIQAVVGGTIGLLVAVGYVYSVRPLRHEVAFMIERLRDMTAKRRAHVA